MLDCVMNSPFQINSRMSSYASSDFINNIKELFHNIVMIKVYSS